MNQVIILPFDNNTTITKEISKKVYSIIESYGIIKELSKYKQYMIRVSTEDVSNLSLSEAHKIWSEKKILSILPPFNLPFHSDNVKCPSGLILIQIEFINKIKQDMGSMYGFDGYILSILVDIHTNKIWDARGEKTS